MSGSSAVKAFMGRALREAGAALKERGNVEVRWLVGWFIVSEELLVLLSVLLGLLLTWYKHGGLWLKSSFLVVEK